MILSNNINKTVENFDILVFAIPSAFLTSELKNQYYKGCIEYLLKKYNYPYEKDKKRGFNL